MYYIQYITFFCCFVLMYRHINRRPIQHFHSLMSLAVDVKYICKGFVFESAAEVKPQDNYVILRLQSFNGNSG